MSKLILTLGGVIDLDQCQPLLLVLAVDSGGEALARDGDTSMPSTPNPLIEMGLGGHWGEGLLEPKVKDAAY